MRSRTWMMAIAAMVACHRPATDVPTVAYPDIAYDESPVSPQTQVMLVAGGDDVANFAAEIVQQRQSFLEAGVRPEQIACYWATPTAAAWKEDLEQYRALVPQLRDCHRATPARIFHDLQQIAAQRPPWLYLYVSAHGIGSILDAARATSSRRLQRLLAGLEPAQRSALDVAAVGLQAGPGPRLEEVSRIIEEQRAGRPASDLMFTPTTVHEALAAFPPASRKILVIQACFSGGFIGHPPRDDEAPHPLADVENLVAIAATSADRPSFGCDAGSHFTYFGGAFTHALGKALRRAPPSPADLDWAELFDRTRFAVEAMEAVAAEQPSRPGMFMTPAPAVTRD